MIRKCSPNDFDEIFYIINLASIAYKGVIPDDRWHEPYMSKNQLRKEIDDGVEFWSIKKDGMLGGIMGIQYIADVTLIRHAYIHPKYQRMGVGSTLLNHLVGMTKKKILIGTWRDAVWAIDFYKKNGFKQVSSDMKDELLCKYWEIPERQIETSIVLEKIE